MLFVRKVFYNKAIKGKKLFWGEVLNKQTILVVDDDKG